MVNVEMTERPEGSGATFAIIGEIRRAPSPGGFSCRAGHVSERSAATTVESVKLKKVTRAAAQGTSTSYSVHNDFSM